MEKEITREAFKRALQIVKDYDLQIKQDLKEIQKTKLVSNPTLLYLVENEEISVRTYNVIKSLFDFKRDTKIEKLQNFDVFKLIQCRNFGNGSMKEVEFVCKKYKITLSTSQHITHYRGINLKKYADIIDFE